MPGDDPRCPRRLHPPASVGSASSARASSCWRVDRQRRVPARPGGVRAARAVAALGHARRGLPPDRFQHRSDALHARRPASPCSRASCARGPSSTLWAWVYARSLFLQVGWPAWAATVGRRVLLPVRAAPGRRRRTQRRSTTSASATFLACAGLLLIGRRIERTLELLNWVLVRDILGGFPGARAALRSGADVARRRRRALVGFDRVARSIQLLPGGRRLLPARRPGGVFGLRRRPQYHAVELGARQGLRHGGARRVHSGRRRRREGEPRAQRLHRSHQTHESMRRWRGWWRIVRADQWGVFFVGRDSRHGSAGACST